MFFRKYNKYKLSTVSDKIILHFLSAKKKCHNIGKINLSKLMLKNQSLWIISNSFW